jgi:hypothetical protein
MNEDFVKAKGQLLIELIRPDGSRDIRLVDNTIVNVGKNFIASRMINADAIISHVGVGTGNTGVTGTDTALQTQLARVALSAGTVSNNVVTYAATIPAGTATGALVEAGLFNNSTGGTMLARTTFAVVNKGASDSIAITWTVTIN